MQYKNINLALLLLASSVIVAAASNGYEYVPSVEEQIAEKIQNGSLNAADLENFNLKPSQIDALKKAKNLKHSRDVLSVLIEGAKSPEMESLNANILKLHKEGNCNRESLTALGLEDHQIENILRHTGLDAYAIDCVLARPKPVNAKLPATVENIMNYVTNGKLDKAGVSKKIELTAQQYKALCAKDFVINEQVVNDILNAPENNSAEDPAETPAKLPATVQNIMNYVKNGKLDKSGAVKNIELTPAQLEALCVKDLVVTDQVVKDILKLKVKETKKSANTTETYGSKVKDLFALVEKGKINGLDEGMIKKHKLTAAQVQALKEATDLTEEKIKYIVVVYVEQNGSDVKSSKAKDLFALVQDGKIQNLNEDIIKKHKLTAAQVQALKEATDLTEDKIIKILDANVEQNGSDVNSSNAGANGEKSDDTKWYTSTWFIVLSSAVVLSALGGGVYMITHKSDKTDL